jgi:hypothetical protein
MARSLGTPALSVRPWFGSVPAGFIGEATLELEAWAKRLEQFRQQTAHVTGDLRFTALKHDAQLTAKLDLARYRLVALKSASSENRVDAMRSVERLWRDLEESFSRRDSLAASLGGAAHRLGAMGQERPRRV